MPNFNIKNCEKDFITIEEAGQLAKVHLYLMLDAIKNGRYPKQNNICWEGDSGIGKTAKVNQILREFFEVGENAPFPNGLYTIDGIRIAYRKMSSTIDPNTITIPSIQPLVQYSQKCEHFMNQAKKTKDDIEKNMYLEMAKQSLGSKLSFVVEDFFEEIVFGQNAQILVLSLDDPNKNPDPGFNTLIKAFTDDMIGSRKLPPTLCMMTMNPYDTKYTNQKMDITVLSTASVFKVRVGKESISYCCPDMPEAKRFFDQNPSLICQMPDGDSFTQGHPCPRSWSSLTTACAYLIKKGEGFEEMIPHIAQAKVGKNAAIQFCAWIKNKIMFELDIEQICKDPISFAKVINKNDVIDIFDFVNKIMELGEVTFKNLLDFTSKLENSIQNSFILNLYDNKIFKELREIGEQKEDPCLEGLITIYFNHVRCVIKKKP